MKNDRIIYEGTIQYLAFRVTSSVSIGTQLLKVSFDRTTWHDAEWTDSSTPILDPDDGVTVIGYERRARLLVGGADGVALPSGSKPAFFKIVDTPEAEIVKGDRNVRVG